MIRKLTAVALIAFTFVATAFAAQTVLSIQPLKQNNYSVVAGDLNITLTACDAVNGNAFTATGHEILLVQNTDGAGAHTITVSSLPDALGRSDSSLTNYSIPTSGFIAIHLSTLAGWRQATGQVFTTCNSNLLKFAVLQTQV
jgi:hypothetical protein